MPNTEADTYRTYVIKKLYDAGSADDGERRARDGRTVIVDFRK